MKKVLLSVVLACGLLNAMAQDTFRIAVVGSSLVAQIGDLPGGNDSLWYRKYAVRIAPFLSKPVKVHQINYIGGKTIGSIDPRKITGRTWSYTNYEYDMGLVDSVLKVNPNLVIITAQTNETANGMPNDTIYQCYKSCIDTLKQRGVAFILTDGFPRQTYFPGGGTAASYKDSTVKFNTWLHSNYLRNTAKMYYKMYDSIFGNRPFPYILGPDSLHLNSVGKNMMLEALLECPLTDSICSDYVGIAKNFSFKKTGANITMYGKFKCKKIIVMGSNNYKNFTTHKTYLLANKNAATINDVFTDVGYVWYKIEVISGKRKDVITLRIN